MEQQRSYRFVSEQFKRKRSFSRVFLANWDTLLKTEHIPFCIQIVVKV